MTHAITRACCNDAACVAVCPTNCIHPSPGDPDFATAEMLHIDPAGCIDCGACVEVCPVDAISPDHRLGPGLHEYLDLNSRYFIGRDYPRKGFVEGSATLPSVSALTVAVVGSGPAAMYAVEHLLYALDRESEIHVYERLLVPWGLVRHGVAPDHQDTKNVTRGFERVADDPRVHMHLGVEVGRDVTVDELAAHHHAVVYGIGSPGGRSLGIPGEQLPGFLSAADLVAWYNGHPDVPTLATDLSGRRAVVIGNGNVALDVARFLAGGDRATFSDVNLDALRALRGSALEEVVVLGRRGPDQAAFTTPELLGLLGAPGVEVTVDGVEAVATTPGSAKGELLRRIAAEPPRLDKSGPNRRVVLRFLSRPLEVLGDDQVRGIRLEDADTGVVEDLDCSLVVTAVGYRGHALPGLPFDESKGRIPHAEGRVLDDGVHLSGTYVVGWAKRGPIGVIGTNKECARETVTSLLQDARAGAMEPPTGCPADLVARLGGTHGVEGWRRLDRREREAGRVLGRPRVKAAGHDSMLELSRDHRETPVTFTPAWVL